jgi:outer membrane protein TolC
MRTLFFRLSFSVSFFILVAALTSLPSFGAAPLSIREAQRIATGDAPLIDAQSAALRAAQQGSLSAGEQSDPKLIVGIDNIPTDGGDRFNLTRESMTMRKIGVMQEFTRDEKLKLRGDRANAEVQKEAAILSLTKLNIRRDVTLAWIERYFAERQLDLVKELAREGELQVTASEATLAGGKGQAADPFAARLALAQLADRMTEAERNIARAQANLARWIGAAAKLPLDTPPLFIELPHTHQDLIGNLDHHPHLAMFAPMQEMAASEMKLANAAKHPDWSLEVMFAQRGPAYSNMLSIGVRIDLPIFQSRRQDPAVASKLALLEQVRAQTEDARRVHAAEIETMLADWQAAKARVERYSSQLLPLAHERVAVSLASYRGGKSDLAPVLEARKGEIDTRINHLMAQNDLARAWAQLNFLLPDTKDPS